MKLPAEAREFAPIPAKDFWSFMVYDSQTRSVLETDQKSGGLDSNNPTVKANADGYGLAAQPSRSICTLMIATRWSTP